MQSRSKIYKGSEGATWIKRLFVHEVQRVFFDRCIATSDIDIMQKYLEDAMGGDNF